MLPSLNAAAKLSDYRARYYDPSTGRFVLEDPFRFKAGINFFTYTFNDPINLAGCRMRRFCACGFRVSFMLDAPFSESSASYYRARYYYPTLGCFSLTRF